MVGTWVVTTTLVTLNFDSKTLKRDLCGCVSTEEYSEGAELLFAAHDLQHSI